jgi:NAD(P)-dependent dehydrogenase (short-subunit alcohol dehydrogenase family)
MNKDQLEVNFMVNYLAPYILCRGLLPILKANGPSMIVNVNAGLYIKGKLDLGKTPTGLGFGAIHSYATTKLCCVLFTIDFAREMADRGVPINAVHPGLINTGLGDSPKLISKLIKFVKRF